MQASLIFSSDQAEIAFEDWKIINPVSGNIISTCAGETFLGGGNIFGIETKLQKYFHIP